MELKANVGDIVKAISGRDKDNNFLVVKANEKEVLLVNGKTRKVGNPKKKNQKHVKVILSGAEKPLAERIASNEPVSNKTIKRTLKALQK